MKELKSWLAVALTLVVALGLIVACAPEATPAPEVETPTAAPAEEEVEEPTAVPEEPTAAPEEEEAPTAVPEEEEAPAEAELQKVLVTLDWVPNEYQNWLWVGMDKGFYAEEGIEVEFFVPTNVETALTAVSAGRTDVGLSISADTIIGVANQDMPVKVVSTIFPRAISGVMRFPDEVATPADMKGTTWSVVNSDTERLFFSKVLESGGLTEDDVEIVDTGFDLVPPFLIGRVSGATSTWGVEQWLAQNESRRRVVQFDYADVGPQNNFNIMANTEWAEANPELCKAFVAGSLKGLKYAMENPEEARDIFIARYPEFDPMESLAWWQNFAIGFHASYTSDKGFGWSDESEWQALIDFFDEGGILDRKPTVDEVVTNEYLPDDYFYAEAPSPWIPEPGTSPVIDAINEAGNLRVGVAEGVLVSKDASGEFAGPGVEIAQWTADALGVELELVESTSDTIVDDLVAGKFDVAVSGLDPTIEVQQAVDLATFIIDPDTKTRTGVAVNKGDVDWVHFVDLLIQVKWWSLQ